MSDQYANSGRHRDTSDEEDLQILLMSIEDPTLTINDIACALEIGYSTTRRRLREAGLFSRVAAKKTALTAQHRAARIRYCETMLNFDQWSMVCFVDESHFCSSRSGPRRIIRPRGERFNDRYITFINFSNRFSVSVFGILTTQGIGPLIRIDGRMNAQQYTEILEDCLPFLNHIFPLRDYFWLQDNCPIHTARLTTEWMHLNMPPRIIDHPPYSPDLNPIENLWGLVKNSLKSFPKASSSEELYDQINFVWQLMSADRDLILNLVHSMPNRLQLCLDNNGSTTRY